MTVGELTSNYVTRDISFDDSELMKSEIDLFFKKPLISLVIPVYNVAPKWLDIAIKSVKDQIYPHWEICIVDDCSTNEETLQYLESIKDSRINIMRLDENSGISDASNKAVSIGKGNI